MKNSTRILIPALMLLFTPLFLTSWFKKVVLHPRMRVRGGSDAIVKRALEMARKYSTIAESVKSEIIIEPEIEMIK